MATVTVTAASTLSWLHSFGGTQNETTKVADKNRVFVVFAQKKAKKTRKVKQIVSYLVEIWFLFAFLFSNLIEWLLLIMGFR